MADSENSSPTSREARANRDDVRRLIEMSQAVKSGDSTLAVEIYAKLPEELRKVKVTQLTRVLAAQGLDRATFETAIQEYRRAFPNDPSVELASLDGLLRNRDFAGAHIAIDNLDRALGGDPYLHFAHGTTFVHEGKLKEAERIARELMAKDPEDLQPYWLQLRIRLKQRDYRGAAELLTKIRRDFGVPLSDAQQFSGYSEFAQSPEYVQWVTDSPR